MEQVQGVTISSDLIWRTSRLKYNLATDTKVWGRQCTALQHKSGGFRGTLDT
jgi:hypothetical protein